MGLLKESFKGEMNSEDLRRLAGEKETVVAILGGGEEEEEEGLSLFEERDDGVLGFGAKKREITCCFFCFTIFNGEFGFFLVIGIPGKMKGFC